LDFESPNKPLEAIVLTNSPAALDTDAPLRRGERRKQHTRRRLLDAAAETYAAVGVEGATISAITERADVGLGTFYLHFEDKDAIAVAVCGVVVARLLDEDAQAMEAVRSVGGDPDPLAIFSRVMGNRAAAEPGLMRSLLRWEGPRVTQNSGLPTVDTNELRRLLLPQLADRYKQGNEGSRYRVEDPTLAAHAVLGVYASVIPAWVASGRTDWSTLGSFIERSVVAMFRSA
jgi:AcrR family transcriptional regulator